MSRSGTCAPAKRRTRLQCERLEERRLFSVTTCTLAGGVLNVACGDGGDAIAIDRQTTSPAITVTIDNQPVSFPAASVQQVRVTSIQPTDFILVDTTLGVPTYVNWHDGANTSGGWLVPQPVVTGTSNLYYYGAAGGPIAEDEVGHAHGSGKLHQIVTTSLLDNGEVPVQPEAPLAGAFAAALVTAPQGGFAGSEGFLVGHAGHVATGGGAASLETAGMGGSLMEAPGLVHTGMAALSDRGGASGMTEPEPGHKPG